MRATTPRSRRGAISLASVGVLVLLAASHLLSEAPGQGADPIAEAMRAQRSGVVVETTGRVEKLLPDDRDGSRHQRFILELDSGDTVLVAHNIDLAPRAPIERGDLVEVRGQYEWDDLGGVLHWTHHDPGGRRPGGWIKVDGETYR